MKDSMVQPVYRLLHVQILACLVFGASLSGAAAAYFYDNFEAGLGSWNATGTWGLDASGFVSPTHCVADSPGAYYTNNSDSALSLASSIDLTAAVRPALSFYHCHWLEEDWDFARIEVSTDGGTTWLPDPIAVYSGTLDTWTREQLDLSAYAGQSDVRIRFRMVTDESVVMDGWYIDDVSVGEAPAAVTLAANGATPCTVSLSWMQSSDVDFQSYVLLRSMSSNLDLNTGVEIADIASQTTTNYTDVAVSPKTKYYYRLAVINSNGFHTVGNVVSILTPAGMDFPFLDNGEGGSGTWTAEGSWALSTETSFSPTHAWSDSPGANYGNNVNDSLTLSAPMNLRGSTSPVLMFNHAVNFLSGDAGYVEISTNNKASWSTLCNYGALSQDWRKVRYDLSAYTNSNVTHIRFRINTDPSGQADGWHIDDISVSESPDTIGAPFLTEITSHSMRLTWGICTNMSFSHYAIFRSTSSGTDFNSTPVTNIYDRATITCVDDDLALNTVYYYRVYAVNAYGGFSTTSADESSALTENNPLPFNEDFENSLDNWRLSGSWDVTDEAAHNGTYSLTDSPYGNYGNSTDSSAETAVDLSGSTWPVLKFWDRYAIAEGDMAAVEISSDGSSWMRVYARIGVAGYPAETNANWTERTIDLSPWRNQSNLRIRFRLVADGAITGDGWYVDDLSVEEHVPEAEPYPLYETFEQDLTNRWLNAQWTLTTNAPYAGTTALDDGINGYGDIGYGDTCLVLKGPLDLTTANDPQLTFWMRGVLSHSWWHPYSMLGFQVSTDNGLSWPDITRPAVVWDSCGDWVRLQASLASYVGQTNVRFRLELYGSEGGAYHDVQVDNLVIEDRPAGVSFLTPVPHLKTIDLSWYVSGLGGRFKRYEVYRSTSGTPGLGDTQIGVFTDPGIVSMVDTGLTIGATYYYGIFVVDTNDTYSTVNPCYAMTVPLTFPLSDPMEDLGNWVSGGDGTWGPDTNLFHGGSASLNQSPGTVYGNNQDTWIMTSVNLSGSTWPVLKFWDRYAIAEGDMAAVEISTDGSSWMRVYARIGVAGYPAETNANWTERTIDLSPWRNQTNVRIRLRVVSDSSLTDVGWYVDDLSVEEHVPEAEPYPLYETFEQDLTNRWLNAQWTLTTNAPYAGTTALDDGINGYGDIGYGDTCLVLKGPLDLTTANDPQLTFWMRGVLSHSWWHPYSMLGFQVSTDNGLSWPDITRPAVVWDSGGDWVRLQASLASYVGQTNVRFRLELYGSEGGAYHDVQVDNLVIEDRPAGVSFLTPVPHLKTIDLSWYVSGLGGRFKRYEVYRSTSGTPGLGDTQIGVFTDPGIVSMVDTGLTIGATYYYGIFVVDTNDTYSTVNPCYAMTVPLTFPLSDPMEDLGNWVSGGDGTWGPDTNLFHGGSASLNQSPGTVYGNNQDTWIMTSVNLSGSTWPVLKFWDRYAIAEGDMAAVEISTDGSSWMRVYARIGVAGYPAETNANWTERTIDLSPWRNQTNVRIRLRVVSDSSLTDVGWYVDDLSVEEHVPEAEPYPLYETFEQDLTNRWLNAQWTLTTNAPYAGTTALDDGINGYGDIGYGDTCLVLKGPLDLTTANDPQLTFWMRGVLSHSWWHPYSMLGFQVSTDNGLSWPDITRPAVVWDSGGDWVRLQASLASYVGQTNVRFRLELYGSEGGAYHDVQVDNLVIEDRPAGVSFLTPVPHLKTIDLSWYVSGLGGRFKRYEIYRSSDNSVDLSDTLIGTFTNVAALSMVDSNLTMGVRYYYGIFVVDTNETYSAVQTCTAETPPITMPFLDGMENMSNWVSNGGWGPDTNTFHSGNASFADSPYGLYANNQDNWIMTSVNLAGSTWPVLKFWDRYEITNGDMAAVEISTDGSSWYRIYIRTSDSDTNWTERILDLSQWRDQSNFRIRFRLTSDADINADGWYVDDVSVEENVPVPQSYPFYENFDSSLTSRWLNGQWKLDTNSPYAGTSSLDDGIPGDGSVGGGAIWLSLRGPLDLSGATDPKLALQIKGSLWRTWWRPYSKCDVHVSTDNGLSWAEIVRKETGWDSAGNWELVQADMASYAGQTNVRVGIEIYCSEWGACQDLRLDNLGIGEEAPSAPTVASPANNGIVPILRPTLTVTNAIDYQGDPLTYRFEIYSDPTLTNIVAQVPFCASGLQTTSWQVDGINLVNNSHYWWRCRATDNGAHVGPWMTTASFYVNESNGAPNAVEIVAPVNGTVFTNLHNYLSWLPTTDPDGGDWVVRYEIQVDDDSEFSSPEVDDDSLVLGDLPTGTYWIASCLLSDLTGSGNLGWNTNYYWRIRAQDSRYAWSDWSKGAHSFAYGFPPEPVQTPIIIPNGGTFTGSVLVTFFCGTAGNVIHYTTDGSSPTTNSTSYVGQFNVTTNLTLKARAVAFGMTDSDVASADFIVIPSADTCLLTVNSAHGTPAPAVGSSSPAKWSTVNASSGTNEIAGVSTQYVPVGWIGSGSVTSGTGTNVTFTISTDSSITWLWKTQYLVSATAGANGTVSPGAPVWIDRGSNSPSYTATPTNGYLVNLWYTNGVSAQSGGSNFTATSISCVTTVSVTFVQQVAAPDFVVTAITLIPSVPASGGSFTALVTVANQGTLAGNAGSLYVYTNKTTNVVVGTPATKSVVVGTLGPGSNKTFTISGLSSGNAGTNVFRAFIDATGITVESNEANNQTTLPYEVRNMADLVVSSITLDPIVPSTGYVFNAAVVLKNQGHGVASNFHVSVWANMAAVPVDSTGESQGTNITSLDVGQVVTNMFLGLDAGTGKVARTLRVFVDSTNGVVEESKTNNQLTKAYTPTGHAEFWVTAISLTPTNPVAGKTFTATVTVTNSGSISGKAGSLYVWADKPGVVALKTPADKSVSVGTLNMNQGKILTITGLTAGTGGTKTFRAFIDATGVTTEMIETNNQTTLSYNVITMADLTISGVILTPSVPARGGVFTAAVTVTNIGSATATGVYVSVWADMPAVPTNNAGADDESMVGNIGPSQSYLYTTVLDAGTGTVARTFRAFADSTLVVPESSETNNQKTVVYKPASRPDFIITGIALSSTNPPVGSTNFWAQVTVTNTGYASGNGGYMDVWVDRATSVVPNATNRGDKYASVGTLAVNAGKTMLFSGMSVGTNTVQRTFRALVDSRALTPETSETNNEGTATYTPQ